MNGTLTGTGTLIRFILRRDRIRLPVWIAVIAGVLVSSAASYPDLYPTAADRASRAEFLDNPATVALTGPGYGVEDYTYGAMIANELLSFTAILVAIMSILLVIRHTRADEEAGRAELVRATAVGRHATTAAALVVATAANLVLAGVIALGLTASIDELSFGSSLLFGLALATVGLAFAGVALLVAQLTEYPRAASGLALGAFGLAYVLRAVGDIGNGVLSWLSPVGWAQATKVYVDDRWWPLGLSLGLAVAATAVAVRLGTRRDLGGGVFATRPGPAVASAGLLKPVGLALRLQRAALLGWGVGVFLVGAMYGSVAQGVEDFVADNPTMEDFLTIESGSVTDQFFSMIVSLLALLGAGYALQAALRVRSEETGGRAEPLLATGMSRVAWVGGHLVVALVGAVVILAAGGLGMGLTAAASVGDAGEAPRLLGAALVYAPAVWLMVGLAVALYGLLPRATPAVWALLGYAAFVMMYGGLLDLPDRLTDLTPFGHTPQLPAQGPAALPLAVLVSLAAALVAAGLIGFRRRDVEMS